MEVFDQYTEYTAFPCHYERLKWLYKTIEETAKKSTKKIKVLDVGCGTGNITVPLGLIENCEIVGIDMHQGNLDVSIAKNTFKNVSFHFSYLQDYPIGDFDFIILTEVLEHIPNYHEIFDYIAKNANQNMQLLITIPNGRGPFEIGMQPLYLMRRMGMNGFIWKVKNILGKKEPYSQNYDTPHVNFFTIPRLRKELKTYGMHIAKIKEAYVFAPVIETYLPFVPLKSIAKIDNKFAAIAPTWLSSGWYFNIRKGD
jgi:SAM-dependent methyltransferase